MRVARCIPPAKIDWTYAPAKFTLGDLLRHLAVAERYMWAENVQGRPARYTTHGKELVDGYDNVMAFVERLHAESMEISDDSPMKIYRRNAKHPMMLPSLRGSGCADGRTRDTSSRASLYLLVIARRRHAVTLWPNLRRSPLPRRRGLIFTALRSTWRSFH